MSKPKKNTLVLPRLQLRDELIKVRVRDESPGNDYHIYLWMEERPSSQCFLCISRAVGARALQAACRTHAGSAGPLGAGQLPQDRQGHAILLPRV